MKALSDPDHWEESVLSSRSQELCQAATLPLLGLTFNNVNGKYPLSGIFNGYLR